MTPDESSSNQRKGKYLYWLEAKLSLAHVKGCTEVKFGVSFQRGPAAAGHQLRACAIQAGLGRQTQVHGVGDGAVWIIHQMEEPFAAQGTDLDFYHTCEHLALRVERANGCWDRYWQEYVPERVA